MADAWRGFVKDGHWDVDVNVRNFIQRNYTQYDGDESFLEGPTEATDKLWGRLQELQKAEREHNGVLECETEVVSSLTAYGPGYIDEYAGTECLVKNTGRTTRVCCNLIAYYKCGVHAAYYIKSMCCA